MANNETGEAMSKITESIVILNLAISFMDGCARDRKFKKIDRDTFEKMKVMLSGAVRRLENIGPADHDSKASDDKYIAVFRAEKTDELIISQPLPDGSFSYSPAANHDEAMAFAFNVGRWMNLPVHDQTVSPPSIFTPRDWLDGASRLVERFEETASALEPEKNGPLTLGAQSVRDMLQLVIDDMKSAEGGAA